MLLVTDDTTIAGASNVIQAVLDGTDPSTITGPAAFSKRAIRQFGHIADGAVGKLQHVRYGR